LESESVTSSVRNEQYQPRILRVPEKVLINRRLWKGLLLKEPQGRENKIPAKLQAHDLCY